MPQVDICTVHMYPLITSSTPAQWNDFVNGTRLNQARVHARMARASTPASIPVWVGEGSPDWRVQGELGHNLTFEMAYVDMAGSIAAEGIELFARQCLNSVVNPGRDVEAGFWVMYTWKQIMGQNVFNATVQEGYSLAQPIRAYSHEAVRNSTLIPPIATEKALSTLRVAILLINVNDVAATVTFALPGVTTGHRLEWHFSQESNGIAINGAVPRFSDGLAGNPDIRTVTANASVPINIDAQSFMFAVVDVENK